VFDTSTYNTTGATITSTSTTAPPAILTGATGAAVSVSISAIRVSAFGASAFPSNASFTASIATFTGTVSAGNTATPVAIGGTALAAASTWVTAGGASAAAITIGTQVMVSLLWSQQIPFTAGANWGEWFTPGFELYIPASTKFGLFVTESSAGTGTTFGGELEFTE
jgi:hypothetical protein